MTVVNFARSLEKKKSYSGATRLGGVYCEECDNDDEFPDWRAGLGATASFGTIRVGHPTQPKTGGSAELVGPSRRP